MPPHQRAEFFEEKGMFQKALRWHRKDLKVARACVVDGEEEDERAACIDYARALRNTGRCLGRLGMRGFAGVSAVSSSPIFTSSPSCADPSLYRLPHWTSHTIK